MNNNIQYEQLAKKFTENKQYNKVIELQEIWQDEQLANNIFVEGQMIRLEVIKWINIQLFCINQTTTISKFFMSLNTAWKPIIKKN